MSSHENPGRTGRGDANPIQVGDEVRVFDGGMIAKGEVEHPGRVVRVGRTLITIVWGDREENFRLADRRIHNYEGEQRFEPVAGTFTEQET